ncbi:aspartate/glutamate racemase family protein [Natranaerobius trueperi]|nr:amino acid racemase [Natranaerobius trueperi]
MDAKTVGVLGGLGPKATVDFMDKVIDKTPSSKDQDHVRMLVDNNPKIPDRTEAILNDSQSPLSYLEDMAKGLENYGADFLVMPCNTAHYFYNDVQKTVNIPFVNMLQCTAQYINDVVESQNRKVGLLATNGTIRTKIYQQQLQEYNLEVIIPESYQHQVTEAIYAVKSGDICDSSRRLLDEPIGYLEDEGAEAIILGCTELPVLVTDKKADKAILVDPTDILAAKTVSFALNKEEQNRPNHGNIS